MVGRTGDASPVSPAVVTPLCRWPVRLWGVMRPWFICWFLLLPHLFFSSLFLTYLLPYFNISSICLRNMVNVAPLTAKICWRVWGTPANFNGFRILALLLHWRCSMDVNQTLHNVWPSPALVYYIYIFGRSCPLTEFCPVQSSLYVQVLHSPILAALLHGTPTAGISQTEARYKEWNYGPFSEGAAYIRLGGHHVGHRPTF